LTPRRDLPARAFCRAVLTPRRDLRELAVKTARQRLEQIAGGRQSGATANRGGVKAALVKSGARFDAPPRFAGACFLSCRFDAPPRCARAGLGHGASRRFDAPPRFARNGRFWRTQKSSGVGELFEKLSEKLSGQLFVIGELFEKLFGKFSEELFVIAKLFEKLFGKFSGKLFAIGELSGSVVQRNIMILYARFSQRISKLKEHSKMIIYL